jgi:dinuclear metal center YbgI/SA1388 family protein
VAVTVKDVCQWMEDWAPRSLAEEWDNPGLLVGHRDRPVHRILTALDATEAVIEEAVSEQCEMIVTHHPMLFHPLTRVEDGDRQGRRVLRLAEQGIALYSAHTNLDTAFGGTNDVLARRIGLQDVHPVSDGCSDGNSNGTSIGILRIGYLPKAVTVMEFAEQVKTRLGLPSVRLATADAGRPVRTIAVCTGSGSEYMSLALQQEADVLLTGDVSYHRAEEAVALGITLLDAGHFGTEVGIAETIATYLNGCSDAVLAMPSTVMRDALTTV